jgi:hypothetical protein
METLKQRWSPAQLEKKYQRWYRRHPYKSGQGDDEVNYKFNNRFGGRHRLGILGEVGNFMAKRQPDFDPRNFGYSKLGQMLKSIDKFEVDERETDKKGIKLVYVRVKA